MNSTNKIVEVLRKHGIEGQFNPDKWEEYIHVLEIEKLSRLDEANRKTRDRLVSSIQSHLQKSADGRVAQKQVEKCPVCGADTIREPSYDNKFGMIVGWRCSEGVGHSMLEGWTKLLVYMTENREKRLAEVEQFAEAQINDQIHGETTQSS